MSTLEDILLFAFDLDGTLTLSKLDIDPEMARLLSRLLKKKKVLITSGGAFSQFKKQLIENLSAKTNFSNLYIIPGNGSSLYTFVNGKWKIIYEDKLKEEEKRQIFQAFEKGLEESGFQKPEKIYGTLIEDRGGQITFSANGADAPLSVKGPWDPDHKKRLNIKEKLDKYLPEFNIKIGGTNAIDVTNKDIDKAYGLNYLAKYLNISYDKIIYVGDSLFPGGNDSSVLRLPIQTRPVKNIEETKNFIRAVKK